MMFCYQKNMIDNGIRYDDIVMFNTNFY